VTDITKSSIYRALYNIKYTSHSSNDNRLNNPRAHIICIGYTHTHTAYEEWLMRTLVRNVKTVWKDGGAE